MIFPKFPLRTESGLMIVNVRFDMRVVVLLLRIGRRIICVLGSGEWGHPPPESLRRDDRRDPCRLQLRADARGLITRVERADADEVKRRVFDCRVVTDAGEFL